MQKGRSEQGSLEERERNDDENRRDYGEAKRRRRSGCDLERGAMCEQRNEKRKDGAHEESPSQGENWEEEQRQRQTSNSRPRTQDLELKTSDSTTQDLEVKTLNSRP
eukprot:5026651-Pleurochrysis_carterae.AAC.1